LSLEFIESAERWQLVYELLPDFPGKIYYSQAYYSACAANGDGRPAAILFVPDVENHDNGVAAAMLQQGRALFYPFLLRAVPRAVGGQGCFDIETAYGYGGPAVFNITAAELLEFDRTFKTWAGTQNIIAEFVRLNPLDATQKCLASIYQVELNRITVSIRLDSGFSAVLDRCTPAKRRNWRRAEREGLHMVEMQDLQAFKSLYGSTMNRLGAQPFYHFSPAYFAALENLPQKNRFFAAVFTTKQKLAAAAVFLLDTDAAHYHLGASDPAFRQSQANVFMMLEFARQQAASGRKMLHLGGGLSLQPDDRLYRFKAGLTTDRHDFFISRRIHQPKIYQRLSRRWQALTGKEPDILLHYHYGVENADF